MSPPFENNIPIHLVSYLFVVIVSRDTVTTCITSAHVFLSLGLGFGFSVYLSAIDMVQVMYSIALFSLEVESRYEYTNRIGKTTKTGSYQWWKREYSGEVFVECIFVRLLLLALGCIW